LVRSVRAGAPATSLRPNPVRFAPWPGLREARLRTQLACVPLHVTNPKLLGLRGQIASLVAGLSWTKSFLIRRERP